MSGLPQRNLPGGAKLPMPPGFRPPKGMPLPPPGMVRTALQRPPAPSSPPSQQQHGSGGNTHDSRPHLPPPSSHDRFPSPRDAGSAPPPPPRFPQPGAYRSGPGPYDPRNPYDDRGRPGYGGQHSPNDRDPYAFPARSTQPPPPPPQQHQPMWQRYPQAPSGPNYPVPPQPHSGPHGYLQDRDRDRDPGRYDDPRSSMPPAPGRPLGGRGESWGGAGMGMGPRWRGPGGSSRFHGECEEALRAPTNTVWIGNLDQANVNEHLLRRTFHEFGKVMLISRAPGKSFCFLHFRRTEEAQRAVETLMRRGTLGPVRYNYAKMYDYTSEEMTEPWDPSMPPEVSAYEMRERRAVQEEREQRDPRNRLRDDRVRMASQDTEDRTRSERSGAKRCREEEAPGREPTNILWVGNLPPSVTVGELEDNFKPFGVIENISRPDARSIAFVYFKDVESCTAALECSRDLMLGGARVTLNYGRAPRNPVAAFTHSTTTADKSFLSSLPDTTAADEKPSNVVYVSQIPTDITIEEIESEMDKYEGLINCKMLRRDGVAFGHFDTVEHAAVCRRGMSNAAVRGTRMFVTFGKSSHTMTMANRFRYSENRDGDASGGGGDGPPGAAAATSSTVGYGSMDPSSGALVASNASGGVSGAIVNLPKMGITVGENESAAASPSSSYYTRARVAPSVTLDIRLQSLASVSYNECGEDGKLLTPSLIQSFCEAVDDCVDEASSAKLDELISTYSPLLATHVFSVVAKRVHEHYHSDPHKKLLVLYAASRALLGAASSNLTFSTASLDAYLVLMAIIGENQDTRGTETIKVIIDSLKTNSFLERQKHSSDYVQTFHFQIDEISSRAQADCDLSSLLSMKKSRKN